MRLFVINLVILQATICFTSPVPSSTGKNGLRKSKPKYFVVRNLISYKIILPNIL